MNISLHPNKKRTANNSPMAELAANRGEDDEEQELQVMQDEEDEEGVGSHHTLKLNAANIVIKSEIFCLAFSDDGRWALNVRRLGEGTTMAAEGVSRWPEHTCVHATWLRRLD